MTRSSLTCVAIACVALLLGGGVSGVTIKSMTVPSAVENNSAAVVLDCEYSLLDSEKMGPVQLVVRWFLNDLPYPVYQWIPGHRPQDNGPLRDRLNLEYRATENPYQRHRAMQILRPSTELAGRYTCKVSTFNNEESVSSVMVVYEPADELVVEAEKMDADDDDDDDDDDVNDDGEGEESEEAESRVNVTCRVRGVYPRPHIELIQSDGPHGQRKVVENVSMAMVTSYNGRYDVTAHHVFNDDDLAVNTTFECLLSLPGTEYQISSAITYQPGPIAAATTTTAAPPPSAEPLDTIEDNDVDYWSSSSTTSLPSVSSPHRSRHLPDDDDDIDDDDGDDDADDASDANGHTKRAHTSLVIDANAAATVTNPTPIGLLLLSGLVAHALAAN